MKISFLLPYANPHVLDWVLKMSSIELNIGCIRSTQEYRPGYFKEYDDIRQIKYFFKSTIDQENFERELKDSDVLFTLGLFEPSLIKLKRFCKRDVRLIVISEPFNPINSKTKTIQRKIWSWLVRRQYRQIDFFCIGGSDVKDYYLGLGFKKSIYYNFGYFPNISFRRPTYKNTGETVRIGFIGQLIHRKGFDRLIRLVEYLTSLENNYELLIVGDGNLKLELLEKQQELDNSKVIYLGLIVEKPKVEAFLESLDVLFVPSYFDGWGAIVNEGIAKSCAIVSSDSVYSYRYLFGSVSDNDIDREQKMLEKITVLLDNTELLNKEKEASYSKQDKISCDKIANEVTCILEGKELNRLIIKLK